MTLSRFQALVLVYDHHVARYRPRPLSERGNFWPNEGLGSNNITKA